MAIRVALFTDTLDEMNGVSRFIRDMARMAHDGGHELTIVTCSPEMRFELPYRVNFKPVYCRRLPYYPDVPLVLPPVRQINRWLREYRPDVLELSTPGAMGLLGMRAATTLGLPRVGVYHTDFPGVVGDIIGWRSLVGPTRKFMQWFYGRLDLVFSRTNEFIPLLEGWGIPRNQTCVTVPFVEARTFRPDVRDTSIWKRMGVKEKHKLLFCGRVSKEKNMTMLAEIFLALAKRRSDTALIVAGYGPFLEQLKNLLKGAPVYYLGYLTDPGLARLYASCDLYVFPSLTDTLGQVVLESQACGTPVVVSDEGGPKEVVADGKTGLVLPGRGLDRWVHEIDALLDAPERLKAMRPAAVQHMRRFPIQPAFDDFWMHFERIVQERAMAEATQPQARPAL